MPAQDDKDYAYFVDDVKYESELRSVTGAVIKAKIPNFERTYSLYEEMPGNEPDILITDDTTVDLAKDDGPRRFYTVPPASFGCR